jgi:hypothetical protein
MKKIIMIGLISLPLLSTYTMAQERNTLALAKKISQIEISIFKNKNINEDTQAAINPSEFKTDQKPLKKLNISMNADQYAEVDIDTDKKLRISFSSSTLDNEYYANIELSQISKNEVTVTGSGYPIALPTGSTSYSSIARFSFNKGESLVYGTQGDLFVIHPDFY